MARSSDYENPFNRSRSYPNRRSRNGTTQSKMKTFIQVRPGVQISSESMLAVSFCQDCKEESPALFLVIDDLWKFTVPEGGIICIACFYKRLGRKPFLSDFEPYPINNLVRYLLTL